MQNAKCKVQNGGAPVPLLLAVLTAWLALGAPTASSAEPQVIGPDPLKQLVLDTRVVAAVEGLRLAPGKVEKDAHNPLFQADQPWENALNNLYPNVTYDGQERLFKLWYKCVLADKEAIAKLMPPATIHSVSWLTLYATSKDGIAWEKPPLGLYGYDGSTANNITARDSCNVGVFHDPHDRDPARRYKMVCDVGFNEMRVRFSADGIHWGPLVVPQGLAQPEGQGRTGDTHNNAFWDPRQQRYVLITRNYLGQRLVARSESTDFLHWQRPQVVLQSSAEEGKAVQTYCMPAFPYANVYLGYVMMYRATGDRAVDCELTWSPDAIHWSRVCPGQPLIPRGPAGSYDAGCIYGPAGPAIVQDGQVLIYYGGSTAVHTGWKRHCLPCLARLRLDGFAGYTPDATGGRGTLITAPLVCSGQPLRITADARGGAIRVAVIDADGYGLDDCPALCGDFTDAGVSWNNGRDLAALAGKTVRLKFEIDRATLYAFGGLRLPPTAQP